jgi:hypothetical protein
MKFSLLSFGVYGIIFSMFGCFLIFLVGGIILQYHTVFGIEPRWYFVTVGVSMSFLILFIMIHSDLRSIESKK